MPFLPRLGQAGQTAHFALPNLAQRLWRQAHARFVCFLRQGPARAGQSPSCDCSRALREF